MNCSKIQRATSSVFVRAILTFCRHSPQLILRLYYVFITAISRGRYLHWPSLRSSASAFFRSVLCELLARWSHR